MSQHTDQGGAAATTGGIVTVASIIVLFVVFVFGLCSIQCCLNALDRRLREQSSSPSGRRRHRHRAVGNTTRRTRGVDPELLRSLPVTVYRAAEEKDNDDNAAVVECTVCLAELEDGDEARFLPRCGHGFHAECVDMWLASHVTCPLCRLTVAKPDGIIPPPAPVPRELANYASNNLPASVLLGVSDLQHHEAVTAGASSIDDKVTATMQLVIEIPDSAAPTLCDAAKSPGSLSLRSIRRLWSFGKGAGPSSSSSSYTCAGGSERAHVK